MTVSQAILLRPLPNRLDEFISRLGKTKTSFEQAGARVSFYRTIAGPEANSVLVVSTVNDWDEWAKASAKVGADADWQALDRTSADDPAAEVLSVGILQEFELP